MVVLGTDKWDNDPTKVFFFYIHTSKGADAIEAVVCTVCNNVYFLYTLSNFKNNEKSMSMDFISEGFR